MTLNRREFVRNVGAGCAAASLGGWSAGTLAAQSVTPELPAAGKAIPSICEMCSFRCYIKAEVVNSKAIFITGNDKSTAQGTRVCARGSSGVSMLYDSNRIVQPMKRVGGSRGNGEWKVIDWDTAYKEIAEKMQTIKADYGAHSVMFSSKSGSLASHLFHLANAFGSPNTFTHATTCPGGITVAANIMMGGGLRWDCLNSKYMIFLGHNLYEGIEVSNTYELMEAQDNGAKVVSFDPRLSVISSKADEWHAIRPGGDLPLLLAMAHVLIKEDLYDKKFIANHTSGFDLFAQNVQNCTPEWAEQHCDVPAETIRRITHEIAAQAPHAMICHGHRATYTPEELDFRRAIFSLNALLGTIEQKGGLFMNKGAALYNKLAGEEVAPVLGKVKPGEMPQIKVKRIDQADPQFDVISKNGGILQSIIDATLDFNFKPYSAKAWIMSRQNPLQTVSDRAKLVETLKAMSLIVCCDVYMTESAAYADYILPDTTYLERDEDISNVATTRPAYAVRQPVVKPIGNTRPSWQIWKELGDALGLQSSYTWKEMTERQLIQLNNDQKLYDRIKEEGYIEFGDVDLFLRDPEAVAEFVKRYPAAQKFLDSDGTFSSSLKFKTKEGRMELFSPSLEAVAPGFGAPTFRNMPMKKEDELFFVQGKVAVHTNGATQYIPILAELMNDNPLWIHPDTAKPLGIKTGDYVWIYNSTGKEKGRALVTTGVRPDTVYAYMGGGAKAGAKTEATYRGIHCSNLLPHKISPVTGTNIHTTGVKIERV
ncbi:MAG: thiosulfate reductase PhsA [Saezia sp.]